MDEYSDPREFAAARAKQIDMQSNGANVGHGHVTPRPDGVKARCGGPPFCSVCARELAAVNAATPSPKPTDGSNQWLMDVYFLIGHAAAETGSEVPAALLAIAERIARAHVDEAHAKRCAEIAAKLKASA